MRSARRAVPRIGLPALAVAGALAVTGCSGSGAAHTVPGAAKTATPAPPSVYFLGDSYTSGVNDMPTSRTYASVLGRSRGWRTVVAGYPFAGFVHTDRYGRDYADLFRRELARRPAPDLLVIAGAHNDRREPSRRIRAKAAALLAGVRRHWPRTKLVVVGPMWGGTPTHAALRVRNAVRAAAKARHVPFIDPLREKWITGDRDEHTGNAPRYVLPDGTHPTVAGHRHMAARLGADLARRGLPR